MKARLLVAAIGIPALLVVIGLPPVFTAVLAALLSAIAAHELYTAIDPGHKNLMLYFSSAVAFALPLLVCFQIYHVAVSLISALILVHFLYTILRYEKERPLPFSALVLTLSGGIVIPMAFSTLVVIRNMEQGAILVLIPFIAAFASDSMALFAGMLFGKHKLAHRVSPKKTIEGSIGGVVGGLLGMIIFRFVVQLTVGHVVSWLWIFAIGIMGSLLGQLGDLSFSVIKREYQIKDYGKLLPGHGGVLDRFDSVLFVAPFVAWILIFL